MRFTIPLFCILALATANCTTVEEKAAKAELKPMTKPEPQKVGSVVQMSKNGKPWNTTLVAVRDGVYEFRDSEGCTWARAHDMFAPVLSWNNCGGAGGTQKYEVKGNMWPLEAGKSAAYHYSGTDANGRSWSGVNRCKVEGTVSVTTVAGEHDTYKVVCEDLSRTRTSYVAPAVGKRVLFINRHNRRGTTDKYELLEGEL